MKVLVLGAGGPAGLNTCHALVRAGHEVFTQDDHRPEWLRYQPWNGEEVDVCVPQPDRLVREVAASGVFPPAFLPSLEVIDRCQAKDQAVSIWADAGLRSGCYSVIEPYPDHLHLAWDRLGCEHTGMWLRATRGAGANKAIKVNDLRSAYHWIRFWETRFERVEWIAEECFPGRDLAWSSIWYQGEPIAYFLRERLEYMYPHLSPEGLTGTPTVARIVHDEDVTDIAIDAVAAVDPEPHGIYSVDLREDAEGVARPTEINAGRSFTTMGLWSLAGGPNYTAMAAEFAIGEPLDDIRYFDSLEEGLTLSRHIDCGHIFTRAPVLA